MTALAEHKCVPCKGGTPPLSHEEALKLLEQTPGWELKENHIEKTFQFPNFIEGMKFANRITKVIEEQDHHPDLYISWGKVRIEYSTHAIGGLSVNDFIMAAKINEIMEKYGDEAQSI